MKRSVVSLSALLALGVPASASAGPSDDADFAAFAQSNVSYCDAKVVAHLWKTSVSESKVQIGRKLRNGGASSVASAVESARRATASLPAKRCSWTEAGFAYEDAEKLGRLWSKSTLEAKALMDRKIASLGDGALRKLLAEAGNGGGNAASEADSRAFFSSTYTYCDAKVLAAFWGTGVTESKERIGRKLRKKNRDTVERSLARGRTAVVDEPTKRCTFDETGFTYADAEKLGRYWKKSTEDAKTLVERKVTMGGEKVVKDILAAADKKKPAKKPAPKKG